MVLFAIIFLAIQLFTSRSGEITNRGEQTANQDGRTYVVKQGENLWTIAETVYKDGFKWTEIAKANNLTDPNALVEGMRLNIPEINDTVAVAPTTAATPSVVSTNAPESTPTVAPTAKAEPTVAPSTTPAATPAAGEVKITGKEYAVVEGDHLWGIAERAYGDGYKWVEIARANKIENPDLIYPGQKFSLPR